MQNEEPWPPGFNAFFYGVMLTCFLDLMRNSCSPFPPEWELSDYVLYWTQADILPEDLDSIVTEACRISPAKFADLCFEQVSGLDVAIYSAWNFSRQFRRRPDLPNDLVFMFLLGVSACAGLRISAPEEPELPFD